MIARKETRCGHFMGYSFRSATRYLLIYNPTDRLAYTMTIDTSVVEHMLGLPLNYVFLLIRNGCSVVILEMMFVLGS